MESFDGDAQWKERQEWGKAYFYIFPYLSKNIVFHFLSLFDFHFLSLLFLTWTSSEPNEWEHDKVFS